jgi:hypothetical protein
MHKQVKLPAVVELLVTVSIILPSFGVQLDHGIDTHDGYAGLDSTLELLDLTHAGFQDTCLDAIMDSSLSQIKPIVLVVLLLGDSLIVLGGGAFFDALRSPVAATELSNELRRVFGGIDCQCLGNNEKRLGEFTDG